MPRRKIVRKIEAATDLPPTEVTIDDPEADRNSEIADCDSTPEPVQGDFQGRARSYPWWAYAALFLIPIYVWLDAQSAVEVSMVFVFYGLIFSGIALILSLVIRPRNPRLYYKVALCCAGVIAGLGVVAEILKIAQRASH